MVGSILIFNGPTSRFKEYIEAEENTLTLNTLVTEFDRMKYQWVEDNEGIEYTLICYGEEFSSINEHFLGILPFLVRYLMQKNCIRAVFIHNPPKLLKDKLTLEFTEDEFISFDIVQHEFPKFIENQLVDFKEKFLDGMIGQEAVLRDVISTIYPLTSKNYDKPIVMMFYGPPGVGKTETALLLNEALSGGVLFRKQLAMFQTNEFGSYLFGGSLNTSSLAKELIGRKSNVILFDEFDKCPSGMHSAFYQMFDEGVFVDRNYEVDIRGSIIICTTNYKNKQEIIHNIGGPIFSRFDQFIPFADLTKEEKMELIIKTYENTLQLWNEEQQASIQKKELKNLLIMQADTFTNVRNIKNGVKNAMAKILVDELYFN
ncbi:AAA family ATPase [Bacillus sp. ISL-37]|uniref:AAA family ATPase n=1 Tax=Bacillus sp. ISL-37 TaxID=2819123 RepID=UPI001BE6AA3A|nr:AAA family ATPase [Bacillus sp. ISL-37]MBT2685418.1 ATP-dependent Clp protease ATP-binding subunit [Bacillus sp. ISL-37]